MLIVTRKISGTLSYRHYFSFTIDCLFNVITTEKVSFISTS